LTARSAERGAEAVKLPNSDSQLKAANVLAQDGGETTIKFQALDINDVASIHGFRDFLRKEHPEGIDVVVNNAGICMDEFSTLTPFHLGQFIADAS
jgi:carbonyl reductase 1